ncbi:MAG: hypothetical protein IT447_02145 [Phycisphaerales bacterium]|nr:hypothetical protein [Phycisphaerales bacterium]
MNPTNTQWRPEAIKRGRDNHIGAQLTQITSAPVISHTIYCEERYCSTDGNHVAFLRGTQDRINEELWVADVRTGQTARLSGAIHGHPASNLYSDNLYYIHPRPDGGRVLMRVNLRTLETDEVFDLSKCPKWRWSVATVSPDDRWFVSNYRVRDEVYGLYRVDMQKGIWEAFHEHQDICNPHLQFEPSGGKDLMVQLNHGCKYDPDGNIIELCGPRGATLYVIDRDGNNPRYLPVGQPHTPGISGHQCWIGDTGKIALTTAENQIHVVAPGDVKSRCIWKGLMYFGHMSTSSDGKYFLTDNFRGSNKLYIGSFKTGRMIAVLDSGASCGEPQYTHPHAYLSPGNERIVFTSDQTHTPQVWIAELPGELWPALDHQVD